MDFTPNPHVALTLLTGAIEPPPFEIAAKRLEMDENVNRARLITHFLALIYALNNRRVFAKAPNE